MRPITRFLSRFWIFRFITSVVLDWRWEQRLYPEKDYEKENSGKKQKNVYRRKE